MLERIHTILAGMAWHGQVEHENENDTWAEVVGRRLDEDSRRTTTTLAPGRKMILTMPNYGALAM